MAQRALPNVRAAVSRGKVRPATAARPRRGPGTVGRALAVGGVCGGRSRLLLDDAGAPPKLTRLSGWLPLAWLVAALARLFAAASRKAKLRAWAICWAASIHSRTCIRGAFNALYIYQGRSKYVVHFYQKCF